jgi:uncharacterized protein YbjT (DUF2867 family)
VDQKTTILITGAAGNLGSLLATHLGPAGHDLRLMFHRRPIRTDLAAAAHVTPVQADLADASTLPGAVDGVDTIVRFVGRVPYYGDTRRARAELIPELVYPTLRDGLIGM